MKNPKQITESEADALIAMMEDKKADIKTPKEKGQFQRHKTMQGPSIIKSRSFNKANIQKKLQNLERSQKNFMKENIFVRDDQLELEIEKNEKQELLRMKYK